MTLRTCFRSLLIIMLAVMKEAYTTRREDHQHRPQVPTETNFSRGRYRFYFRDAHCPQHWFFSLLSI
jgi:hypothetical protein